MDCRNSRAPDGYRTGRQAQSRMRISRSLGQAVEMGLSYCRECAYKAAMENTPQAPLVSKKMIWAGRIMSAVPVLMLALSAFMKFMKPPQVVEGFAHFGFPPAMVTGIGILELLFAVVYVIPSTAILGAILVTAFLGGATVTTLRTGDAYYGPIVLGILVWGGLYLRDLKVRALIPFRR
jgi:hypothetical protein